MPHSPPSISDRRRASGSPVNGVDALLFRNQLDYLAGALFYSHLVLPVFSLRVWSALE